MTDRVNSESDLKRGNDIGLLNGSGRKVSLDHCESEEAVRPLEVNFPLFFLCFDL